MNNVCISLPVNVQRLFHGDILSTLPVSWDNHDVCVHSFFSSVFSRHRCMGSRQARICNRLGDSKKERNESFMLIFIMVTLVCKTKTNGWTRDCRHYHLHARSIIYSVIVIISSSSASVWSSPSSLNINIITIHKNNSVATMIVFFHQHHQQL